MYYHLSAAQAATASGNLNYAPMANTALAFGGLRSAQIFKFWSLWIYGYG
jgi:hypothetical protein